MWECLNDSVIIRGLKVVREWKEVNLFTTWTSEVYNPENSVDRYNLMLVGDVSKDDEGGDWWVEWNVQTGGEEILEEWEGNVQTGGEVINETWEDSDVR